jgi:pyroglutamyl-peptidase
MHAAGSTSGQTPERPHGCVLVTGFEPFAGDPVNPSGDAARLLDGQVIAGRRVHGVVLPCVFATAPAALRAAIEATRPEMVLCLGLAASRLGFQPERVAINLVDARIPDNAGAQPVDEPVIAGAPAAAFTDLPVKAMVAALVAAGHGAAVSYSAGTFVCNQVFFALTQALAQAPAHALPGGARVRGGFMHLGGDLDGAAAAAGVRVALTAALDRTADLGSSAGRID